jgi:RNA polymerase sigma factor (sigma-70 family)
LVDFPQELSQPKKSSIMAQDPESSGLTPLNSGDKEVYNQLYNNYYQKLLLFLIGEGIDINDAKDILNEIFLKLWEKPVTFESATHAPGYLYRSARNRRINYLRDRKGHLSIEDELLHEIESPDSLPNQLDSKMIRENLEHFLTELSPREAQVIRLYLIKGLSPNEIAQTLGITPDTVREHRNNGLLRLAEALGKRGLLSLLLALLMNLNFF